MYTKPKAPADPALAKLNTDPDWIALKRYDHSLSKLLSKYQDEPVPDDVIAAALLIDEDEVEVIYQQAVFKLRGLMGL